MKDLFPRKRYGTFPLRVALALCTVSALSLGLVAPGGLLEATAQEVAEAEGISSAVQPEVRPADSETRANEPTDSVNSKDESPAATTEPAGSAGATAPTGGAAAMNSEETAVPENLQAPAEEREDSEDTETPEPRMARMSRAGAEDETILGSRRGYSVGTAGYSAVFESPFKDPAYVTKVTVSGRFSLTPNEFQRLRQYFDVQVSLRKVQGVRWDLSRAQYGQITLLFPEGSLYTPDNYYPGFHEHYVNVLLPPWLFTGALNVTVYGMPFGEEEPAPAPSDPRLIGGDWREKFVAENPPMPQRCGLNIALVFDLSNSVGLNGLENTKISGQRLVNALSGTPTNIGIFNFGTEAPVANTKDEPRLDLTDRGDVQTALNTIRNFDYGSRVANDKYTDWGGTNWEGALRNVRNSGVDYDVVYFVTDGVPTTNIAHLPQNAEGKAVFGQTHDNGRITHNGDITIGNGGSQQD